MAMQGMSLSDRFSAQYVPEPMSGCWLWTGAYRPNKKYPDHSRPVLNAGGKDRRILIAARVSWTLHKETPIGSLHVLHSCDNAACVNPEHLWLGTHQDNMLDAKTKGRMYNGYHKLCLHLHEYTPENTRLRTSRGKIVQVCLTCEAASLARSEFDGRADKHRTRQRNNARAKRAANPGPGWLKGESASWSKLTVENVLAIRASPEISKVEAARYDVTPSTIRDIRRHETWKHVP